MAIGDLPVNAPGPSASLGGGSIGETLGKLATGNPGLHVMLHAHMPPGGLPPGVFYTSSRMAALSTRCWGRPVGSLMVVVDGSRPRL